VSIFTPNLENWKNSEVEERKVISLEKESLVGGGKRPGEKRFLKLPGPRKTPQIRASARREGDLPQGRGRGNWGQQPLENMRG